MKNRYLIAEDAPRSSRIFEQQAAPIVPGEECELELTPAEERALIAAGWISERIEEKSSKGGKG